MAINLATTFPTKTNPAGPGWEYGEPRNISAPGALDGTPWIEQWQKDFEAWRQWTLSRGGETPNNNPDTTATSQVVKASGNIYGITIPLTTDALALDLELVDAFRSRAYSAAGDLGCAAWRATGVTIGGSAGTTDFANGKLYDVNGREFLYESAVLRFEAMGNQFQNVVDFQTLNHRPIVAGGQIANQIYNLGAGAVGLIIRPGTTIIGAAGHGENGAPNTFKVAFSYTGTGVAFDMSAGPDDVRLEGFRLHVFDINATGIDIDNSQYCLFRDLYLSGGTDAVNMTGAGRCGFYNCRFKGTNGSGLEFRNVFQTVFQDCRFESNVTDAVSCFSTSTEASSVLFLRPSFENGSKGLAAGGADAITVVDAYVEMGCQQAFTGAVGTKNPKIYGGRVNVNGSTGNSSMLFGGYGGLVNGVQFSGGDGSDIMIETGSLCEGLQISDCYILQEAGKSVVGVKLDGKYNAVRDTIFEANSTAMTAIIIVNGSTKNRISGPIFRGITSAPIVDPENSTIYEDAIIAETAEMAIDGGRITEGFFYHQALTINRVWVVYPVGTGATSAQIQIGRCLTPGSPGYNNYLDVATSGSAATWSIAILTGSLAPNPLFPETGVLLMGTDGTAANPGTVKIIAELTPYRTQN